MNIRNFVIKSILLFTLLSILNSCGSGKRNPLKDLKPTEGGVSYGGNFIYNEVEDFKSLYPLNVTEIVSYNIANQIYEGLVRLSMRDLTVQAALAENWELDSLATTYTFHLRKGVFFQSDECFANKQSREVLAKDFKYCLDRICAASPTNHFFWLFMNKVVGADEYYQSTINGSPLEGGVSGIEVIDEYTLQIKLTNPFASFLYLLAMPPASVYPKEAVEKYGDEMRIHCVGTGPFKVKEVREGDAVILTRNPNYWGVDEFGNKLPYLDLIKVVFIKEKKSELLEFQKGTLDMVYKLPLEMIDNIVDKSNTLLKEYQKYNLQISPALSLQYYGFQHKSDLFKNKLVRQAFNAAIDRKKIVDFTLKSIGIPALYGVVPPAIVGYDSKAVKGASYNADKAKQLLAEAGYPNGEGFPELTLSLNSGGGTNIQIAEAIQKMLEENLNIKVNFSVVPFAQNIANIENGKAIFWRSGWIADYPDPENYLNLFYGARVPASMDEPSYINTFRYQNPKFDKLLETAIATTNIDERNELYAKADQILADDAAIIPIYYEKSYRLIQPYVRNFYQNPMEFRTFREVFFSDEKVEEPSSEG